MAIFPTKRRKRRSRRRRRASVRIRAVTTAASTPAAGTPTAPPAGSNLPIATARERLHLNRFGTGFTQAALAGLRAAGSTEAWLEAQMVPGSVPESAKVAEVDGWFPDLRRTPAEKAATNSGGSKKAWEYGHDLGNWSILRRTYSERSVLETMVEFWTSVLHIPTGHDRAWVYQHDYDATIRRLAFGTYEDLLIACSLHPAMRVYLDNWRSVRGKPNENQGRELLELHSVGRDGGYTEAMVKASAVLLSGYTVDWGKTYAPVYNTSAHTTGPVQVLDFTHANASSDGQAATLAYLKYLAHHPATARYLMTKLATFFVSDSPSQELIDALAAVYLSSGTSIPAVLRELSAHPEFLTSEGLKVRTPVQDLVATARALDVQVNAPTSTNSWAFHANYVHGGPRLFSWPRPDGPPLTGRAWSSASRLFSSYKMHRNQAGGYYPPQATYRKGASWLPTKGMRFDAYVDHLCRSWLGRAADARLVQAACQVTSISASTTITATHAAATYRFVRLANALLDTPDHMTT